MNYTAYLEEVKTLNNVEQEKALALAMHLQLQPEEDQTLDDFLSQIASTDYDPTTYTVPTGEEYLVLTNEEADQRWEESLENFIDEIIFPGIPNQYQQYFDTNRWKDDARIDARGHSLSSYDGNEEEQEVNGTTYYIYRTN